MPLFHGLFIEISCSNGQAPRNTLDTCIIWRGNFDTDFSDAQVTELPANKKHFGAFFYMGRLRGVAGNVGQVADGIMLRLK